jgi:hypothetical protein
VDHFVTALSADARLLTLAGFVTVAELVGSEPTIWSGCAWVSAHVVQSKRHHNKYRVRANNGLDVECDKGQSWSLLKADQTLESSCTCCLEPGQRMFPFNMPQTPPPAITHTDIKLVEKGRVLGAQTLRSPNTELWSTLTDLSRAEFRDFLGGWVAAQRGHIQGSRRTISALHLKIIEIGCGPCQTIERNEDSEELYLSRTCAEQLGVGRERCVVSQPMPPSILSVEKVGKGATYYVALKGGSAFSILVNGILLLAPQLGDIADCTPSRSISDARNSRTVLYQIEDALDSGQSDRRPETPELSQVLVA